MEYEGPGGGDEGAAYEAGFSEGFAWAIEHLRRFQDIVKEDRFTADAEKQIYNFQLLIQAEKYLTQLPRAEGGE